MEHQTQGKLFIVTGSLWLLASLYFLITAFFPNKIENNRANDTLLTGQQWDIRNTTGAILTGQGGEINILIPQALLTSGFGNIVATINKIYGIHTTFIVPAKADNNTYTEIAQTRQYTWQHIDIIMIPMDVINIFSKQSKVLPLAEDITSFYDIVFTPVIQKKEYTFIPHAIDPLIIFSQNEKDVPTTIQDWRDKINNWKATTKYHTPIAFGISEQERNFMKQGKELFDDYFLFFYRITQYIITWPNANQNMTLRKQIAQSNKNDIRHAADFIVLTNKLAKRNNYCTWYPTLCIFNYNFMDNIFGFLSDNNILKAYFTNTTYTINPFFHNEKYPARWRWFLVYSGTEVPTQAMYFLETYLQKSISNIDTWLRNNTIPASNLAQNAIDYSDMPPAISDANTQRDIITGDGTTPQQFIEQTDILKVIDGSYDPTLFLKSLKRNF